MADEYIKRILAKAEFTGNFRDEYPTALIHALLDNIPAADVRPVRHGWWMKSEIPGEKFVCSECGGACWYYDYEGEVARSRCCPNCGATMDGGET